MHAQYIPYKQTDEIYGWVAKITLMLIIRSQFNVFSKVSPYSSKYMYIYIQAKDC